MKKDRREARISELEKEINLKSQELAKKSNELKRLKIEDSCEKLQLKIGDIIRISSNWSYPTMMKIESISEPMLGPLTIRGCSFTYNPIAQYITIQEDCSIYLNSCDDEIPTIELASTNEWNEALEKLITKTDKMKC